MGPDILLIRHQAGLPAETRLVRDVHLTAGDALFKCNLFYSKFKNQIKGRFREVRNILLHLTPLCLVMLKTFNRSLNHFLFLFCFILFYVYSLLLP